MSTARSLLAALALATGLAPASLWARDTPSNMDVPAVTPADPLQTARSAISERDWPAALTELQRLLPQMPRNADLHNLLGYTYRQQARPDLDQAFEHYRQALDIDPAHRGAHEYIGEAYLMRRQPDQARQHLEALRRLCGGTTCEEYQDLAKALAAYRD